MKHLVTRDGAATVGVSATTSGRQPDERRLVLLLGLGE
jgi:hypothetical protein